MMLRLETTGQFRKDYKRVKKRGYDMDLLENVIQTLLGLAIYPRDIINGNISTKSYSSARELFAELDAEMDGE